MKTIIAFGDSISFPSKDGISAHTIGNLLVLAQDPDLNVILS